MKIRIYSESYSKKVVIIINNFFITSVNIFLKNNLEKLKLVYKRELIV